MRQTLQSLFGLELTTAQRLIVAVVVILVLLALLGLFVRQIKGGRLRLHGQAGGRQRQPRLGVVDTYDLDRQRQLILIRRDNIEHLIMIGGASDVVVETNILRSGGRAVAPSYAEAGAPDRPLPPFETLSPAEPMPRPEEEHRKAPAIADAPDVLPSLPGRSTPTHGEIAATVAAGAGVAAALGLAAEEREPAPVKPVTPPAPVAPPPPVTAGPAPSFAREHAPPPAVSADELDDMTRQLEEALKRPFSAVRPAHIQPDAAPEVAAPPVKSPAETAPPAEAPVVEAPKPRVDIAPPVHESRRATDVAFKPEPVPAPTPAVSPRQAMSAADVEAELAAALGLVPERAAPVAPAPKVAEPKAPEAKALEPKVPEPKPVETKAPEAAKPEPKPVVAPDPPREVESPVEEPEAIIDEEEREEAVVEVEALKPQPEQKAKADEAPAAEAKDFDPFSVDAIEAEFARLLGRDPKAKS
ncbi:conserved hypothetical protein [Hyphomicrobiales bacterium]|nr:conserved hypothetical protein [Hyphomicrobiales bacterium]CAH1700161.1 conserved hypothetical protein [Hyphomicrobiales bacterium]CAI0343923.1 conserved hypothetical protein [Hyphomicrobiales bacterium]